MKKILSALVLVLATVAVLPQGAPGVNVDLGVVVDTFNPGDPVEFPITLVTRNDPQVGSISLEVAFPSAGLSLTGAALPDGVEAELETQLRDEEGGERKILSLEITSTQPISQGVLVTVTFEIAQEMAINGEIQLENLSQSSKSLNGDELSARGLDGSITSIEFIPACFFYMH
jgi:hypothetical protein